MVRVYETGNSFAFTIEGGEFKQFKSEPKAIILNSRPIPTKWWRMPREKVEDRFKKDYWQYNYSFREFDCDGKNIFILEVDYTRFVPGYAHGKADFFVEETYVKRKLELLRNEGNLAEYHWDIKNATWIEIERGFKDEFEDLFEKDRKDAE